MRFYWRKTVKWVKTWHLISSPGDSHGCLPTEKSGWEVSQTLRKNESTQDIPIIILTAHVFPEDRRKAEDLGCNSFLPKPLKPREVLHEIQSLLHPVNQP